MVFGNRLGEGYFAGKREQSQRERSNRRKGKMRAAARVLLLGVATLGLMALGSGSRSGAQGPIFDFTTFPASGATTVYVADLAPNTTYGITADGAPTTGVTDTAGVLVFNVAGTGDVTVRGLTSSSSVPSLFCCIK
jgi:hypothetical protein